MSPQDAGARSLARTFLEQTLAAEGDALMLEHATRVEIVRRLTLAQGAGRARLRPTPEAAVPVEVSEAGIAEAPDLEALAALVAACSRCALHESRRNAVFGEGAADARVVCVGEAPGAREDETGRPFVGRAGNLLDRLLVSIGLPRTSVYICNVLKSRPPRNRDPLPEEVAACSPYLLRQLALIRPEVIIAFGAFAARTLLETKSALGRLRGRVHRYSGYPVVVTYHPAALLRNPGWIRPTWEDLQIVRRMLDGAGDQEARGG
ncbi:uracil-DNA glycosylase [Candidatus Palauibacter sp.]|uniref:uracil-DNA glycosylase n=1 Tax=Candidatus Palauibacter sp. TaxID=3101350 RepID=UPI003B58B583